MYKVTLRARGKQFDYNSAPDQSPLDAARNEFIPFPVGCRRGGCGMCKVKVLNGDYEQDLVRSKEALSDEELENSFALGCCMTPKSDLDLISIEDYENSFQKADIESVETRVLYPKYALTQSIALRILETITNKAEELGIKVNAAVIDDGANLKAFIRMDEAPLLSGTIAQNKAYTSAAFGRPTHEWYSMIKDDPALLTGIVHTDRLVVFGGGFPLIFKGIIVGGIGVSGGTSDQDVQCALAGLKIFEETCQK
ncbi:heme-binding protein [Neobacillus vireti]|uniref:heme-binding protein n=1 Tax=Neobacillus vireti TaxID=220686 RepID=UPI0030003286